MPNRVRQSTPASRRERDPKRRAVRVSPAYAHQLPPARVHGPGDRLGARRVLHGLRKLRLAGGWSRGERANLKAMERLWERRAAGLDAWYNVVGNRGNRKLSEMEKLWLQKWRSLVAMVEMAGESGRRYRHGN